VELRAVGRHVDGPSAVPRMVAAAVATGLDEVERGDVVGRGVWCVTFDLHSSAAVTERAADLVADRCRRAGAALVLRFRADGDAARVVRRPALPLAAFADLEAFAVEVPEWHYLTETCTLVLPTGRASAGVSVAALAREIDVDHCRADEVLAVLDGDGPPAALRRALAQAVHEHDERFLVDALGGGGDAVSSRAALLPA
jgi:hypothetical protein